MTCSSCTLAVEQALSIPGVLSVTVSLMQAEAKVEYGAGTVTQASTELCWASTHPSPFTSMESSPLCRSNSWRQLRTPALRESCSHRAALTSYSFGYEAIAKR